MNKRLMRVLSLFLVLVMVVSMGTSAFAEGPVVDPNIEIGGDLGGPIAPPDLGEPEDPEPEETEAPEEPEEEPEEAPDMPALNFYEEDEETGLVVTVDAPEGALPEEAELRIARVEVEDIREKVEELLEGEHKVLLALDLSFCVGEEEVEPLLPVQVKITAPELEGDRNLTLVHIPDSEEDGEEPEAETLDLIPEEELDFELGTNEVVFESDSFSIYAIVEDETHKDARLAVEFYGSDATTPIQTVYVTAADVDGLSEEEALAALATLVPDPEVPAVDEGQIFRGWSVGSADYGVEDGNGTNNIEYVRGKVLEKLKAGVTEGETLKVYAMIFYVFRVTYMDENGETTMETRTYLSKDSSTEVEANLEYTPYLQGYSFNGWQVGNTDTVVANGENITITENTTLRATVLGGYWLSFEENPGDVSYKGATYVAPVFCPGGVVPENARPTDPTLAGYDFGGWYMNYAKGATAASDVWSDEYGFTGNITGDTTVYAKWTLKETVPYTVIVWKQNIDDDKNAEDADKTYEYAFASTKQVAPGTAVSELINNENADLLRYTELDGKTVTSSGVRHSFYGFKYNTTKGVVSKDSVVQASGTTVVNLYYDRETVTYIFYESKAVEVPSAELPSTFSATSPVYYVYQDGTLLPLRPEPGYESSYTAVYQLATSSTSTSTEQYAIVDGVWYKLDYDTASGGTVYYWWYQDSAGNWATWDGARYYYNASYYIANNAISQYTVYKYEWENSKTFTGLYEQKLSKYDYVWSTDYQWYIGSADSTSFLSVAESFYRYNDSVDWTTTFYGLELDPDAYVYHYQQMVNGEWPTKEEYKISCTVRQGMMFREFTGFSSEEYRVKLPSGVSEYQLTTSIDVTGSGDSAKYTFEYGETKTSSDGWTEWIPYGTTLKYDGFEPSDDYHIKPVGGAIEFRYSRNRYRINYLYGNGSFVDGRNNLLDPVKTGSAGTSDLIYFEDTLDSYAEGQANYYDPTSDLNDDRYVFDGWYVDPNCTTPYDFTGKTMPLDGVTVYAKFHLREYRVFLWPNLEEGQTVEWNDPDQAMNFRVNYLGLISSGQMIDGKSDGYVLVGWYLDENFEIPFNFATQLNDDIATDYDKTDLKYATDVDNNGNLYNKDVSRPWIDKKIEIYAKWRKLLPGANGINVVYDAVSGSGAFDGGATLWADPLLYADQTTAYGRSASTPTNSAKQFQYWEILDKDGNPVPGADGRVYPGQEFTVDAQYAVEGDIATGESSGSNGTDALTLNPENLRIIRNGFTVGTMATTKYVTDELTYTNIGVTSQSYTEWAGKKFTSDAVYAGMSANGGNNSANKNSAIQFRSSGNNIGIISTTSGGKITEVSVTWDTGTATNRVLDVYGSNTAYTSVSNLYNNTNQGTLLGSITYDGTNTSGKVSVNGDYAFVGVRSRSGALYLTNITFTWANETTESYTVIFESNGGSAVTSQTVESGETATKPADPTRSGYTFGGWYTDSGLTTAYNFSTPVTGNLTLYAKWTQNAPTTYTVTFNANGGSAVTSQTVESGKTATKPADPTKNGYTFGGWYTDESYTTAYEFSAQVTSNLTLYAKWIKIETYYTVTFNENHNGATSAYQVAEGTAVSSPVSPTRENYVFTGWYTEAACTNLYDFSAPVNANMTLYAGWTAVTEGSFVVTFKDWNGTILKTESVAEGGDATPPDNPTRSGYTFKSWNGSYTNVQSNVTVTALYTKDATTSYTITLRAVYGPKPTVPTINFKLDPNGLEFVTDAQDSLIELYTGYSVSLSETEYMVDGVKVNAKVQLPGAGIFVENPWITVTGWNTEPDGTGENFTLGQWVGVDTLNRTKNTEANTLYAMWEGRAAFYHSFNNTLEKTDSQIAGVVGTVVYSTYNTDGVTLNIPENMVPAGYLYGGYYTAYNGATNYTAATGAVSEDGTPYSGVNYLWDEKNAGTNRPGDAFVTTKDDIGKTFYIKEVPDGALRPATYYTYYKNTNGDVGDIFFISAIDDLNYEDAGFLVGSDPATATKVSATKVVKTLKISAKTTNESVSLTPAGLFGSNGSAGSYWMQDVSANANSKNRLIYAKATGTFSLDDLQNAEIRQYWVTPDGVLVTGQAVRVINNVYTTSITETTTADTSRIKGVKLTSNTGTTA